MLTYRYPLIAREGWLWIAIAILLATLVYVLDQWASLPLWLLVLGLLYLYRDPVRKIPAAPLAVVSPVDGKVISVGPVRDGFLDRQALCVSIRMGFFSVYSVHSPMEGKVMQQWLGVARNIEHGVGGGKRPPGCYAQWIQSDEEDDVLLVIDAVPLMPRPRCYAQTGERIGQGQRCGFIPLGTQVDILLPEKSRIEVSVGDTVLAGSAIMATLVHARVVAPKAAEADNA
jgi:phosphatidylserine decarboxylase